MSTPKFAETHNLVAFLEKPEESSRFEEIIDFLNTNSVQYALKVNLTIYTTCIEQFWISAKAKTVNEERQIQALVDKKKVITTETSIRSDLKLNDAEGTYCLPTATIFVELERMGAKTTVWNEFSSTMASAIICLATNQKFNFSKYIFDNMMKKLEGEVKFLMYPRFMQVFLDKQVEGMTRHKEVYVTPSHTKKVFANMKRPGNGFSRRVTPLFPKMMIQASKDMGEDSAAPSDSHSTPIISQPSSSKPQKKKSRRKQRKESGPTEPVTDEAHVSTPSYDPPQSGEDSMQLSELMNLCTSLQEKVLDLEKAKTAQAKEIVSLKKRVNQLEKRRKLRTPGLKRLRKVGSTSRVKSSNDVSLGDQEDASKQGRKIADLDADSEVTLVDETQEMNDENLMFDTYVLEEQEKEVDEKEVSTADPVTIVGEVTLIKIKAVKPKAVTSAATTTTTTRPKAKGVVVQEPSEFKTTSSPLQASQLPQAKDKGKAIMVEPERPLKKKDQVALDEEMTRNIEAQMQVKLIEEERVARQKEEEANIALIESWDSTRKKHFAKLRTEEIRRKPPTKAQKKNQMSTYLKNMAGYKHKVVKDDQEEAEMKRHIEIVKDDEVAIDAIPLATKPPVIVEYKIDKDGRMGYFKLIRADGSSKRYSSMIKMLQDIDREDLETLWKLVKAKHENTRPGEDYERVL
ncbi:hypothetical protein Tco_1361933 [Tanacetum coccineum]